jgi:ribA/ribD-fused uncharacterized protein
MSQKIDSIPLCASVYYDLNLSRKEQEYFSKHTDEYVKFYNGSEIKCDCDNDCGIVKVNLNNGPAYVKIDSNMFMENIDTDTSIYFNEQHNVFMSNNFHCKFTIDEITFNSITQYYVYEKCMMFDPLNNNLIKKILNEQSFKELITIENEINVSDSDWNESDTKYNIIKKGQISKFTQNPYLKKYLLETGNKKLYYMSNDNIWGIGICVNTEIKSFANDDGKLIYDHTPTLKSMPISDYGLNLLGKCLMEVREVISYKL